MFHVIDTYSNFRLFSLIITLPNSRILLKDDDYILWRSPFLIK